MNSLFRSTFNRRRLWRPFAFLESILIGDRGWGTVRLLLAAGLILLAGYLSQALFAPDELAQVSPFALQRIRYIILPLAALISALVVGSHYVKDIYELPEFSHGLRYLLANLFGIAYPRLTISEGKKKIAAEEINLLDVIGGPGYVKIEPGNVVLFERLDAPSNVRGEGRHFVTHFETIRETFNLDDQHGHIEAVSATTKDGIEVRVSDIHFYYRMRSGKRPGSHTRREQHDPYPFSIQSVWNAAYNRSVTSLGLVSWHETVKGAVRGLISETVSLRRFDELAAPAIDNQGPKVREDINRKLASSATRERFKNLGAELLFCDIGHFAIVEPLVASQIIETWGAKWVGDAKTIRALGEARRSVFRELGRAQAQATMVLSILGAIGGENIGSTPRQNLRRILLARTAQILDGYGEELRSDQTLPQLPPGNPTG